MNLLYLFIVDVFIMYSPDFLCQLVNNTNLSINWIPHQAPPDWSTYDRGKIPGPIYYLYFFGTISFFYIVLFFICLYIVARYILYDWINNNINAWIDAPTIFLKRVGSFLASLYNNNLTLFLNNLIVPLSLSVPSNINHWSVLSNINHWIQIISTYIGLVLTSINTVLYSNNSPVDLDHFENIILSNDISNKFHPLFKYYNMPYHYYRNQFFGFIIRIMLQLFIYLGDRQLPNLFFIYFTGLILATLEIPSYFTVYFNFGPFLSFLDPIIYKSIVILSIIGFLLLFILNTSTGVEDLFYFICGLILMSGLGLAFINQSYIACTVLFHTPGNNYFVLLLWSFSLLLLLLWIFLSSLLWRPVPYSFISVLVIISIVLPCQIFTNFPWYDWDVNLMLAVWFLFFIHLLTWILSSPSVDRDDAYLVLISILESLCVLLIVGVILFSFLFLFCVDLKWNIFLWDLFVD